MSPEYRIVTDNYSGYEVQVRRWWWPFWIEADFVNTHSSIDEAERFAERHAKRCVKYLGRFYPVSSHNSGDGA